MRTATWRVFCSRRSVSRPSSIRCMMVLSGLDERSFIIFVNQVACELIGIPEANLIGKYAPDVALENDLLRNLLVTDQHKMKIYADNRESYYSKEYYAGNEQGQG